MSTSYPKSVAASRDPVWIGFAGSFPHSGLKEGSEDNEILLVNSDQNGRVETGAGDLRQ